MKAVGIVATAALLFVYRAAASDLTVDTDTYASTPPAIVWWGSAVYTNDQDEIGIGVPMSAGLGLWDDYGDIVSEVSDTTYAGSWSFRDETHLEWGFCYRTSIAAQTFDRYAQGFGGTTCNPKPPENDPPPYQLVDCERQPGDDPVTQPSEGSMECWETPIILNLDRGSYRLTGVSDGVLFDLDADGTRESVAWTQPGTLQAFLALDRNSNGRIDDGAELFGNHMRLPDGSRAATGFAALASFDANSDGVLNGADAGWAALVLWVDRNHDGVSQSDELRPLTDSGIVALSYDAVWTGRRDENGNLFAYRATYRIDDRSVAYYDVFLRSR